VKRIALLAALAIAVLLAGAQSAAAAVPTVTALAPGSGPPAWSVTLTGTGFTGATDVTFAPTDSDHTPRSASFTVQNDTTVVAKVPFFDVVPLGATVTVTTADGSANAPGTFLIDGRVTASEYRGSSGEPIVLTGSGFEGTTAVRFGTWPTHIDGDFTLDDPVKVKFHVVSDTRITATVPALRSGRRYWVEVESPTATSVSAHSKPFLVVVPRLLNDSTGKFLVRPTRLSFGVSGQFLVGKLPDHKGRAIRWRHWAATARGTGTVWRLVGVPAYLGHYIGHNGAVTATRLRGGHYTRLAVSWRQHFHRKVERFKLRLWADGSRWGWF